MGDICGKDMKTLRPGKNQKQWNVASEGRDKLYREWRIKGNFGAVQDIDQLEYIIDENGEVKPVAIVELTKAEDWIRKPEAYLQAIDNNEGRIKQQKVARSIAKKLGIPAFYLVFEDKFDRFFVKCLTGESKKWSLCTPVQWKKILKGLSK